eukprot:2854126-Amphidinium_carterae.1
MFWWAWLCRRNASSVGVLRPKHLAHTMWAAGTLTCNALSRCSVGHARRDVPIERPSKMIASPT